MASKSQISLIRALAQKRGLDPAAVLAVAKQEGLAGGIGDQGTSFGPFQLHVGGAFPKSIQGNRQAWAWSPQGIAYALNQIQNVAGGLKGSQAIKNIVTRFERPADPASEIQGALRAYGAPTQTVIPSPLGSTYPTALGAPAPNNNPFLQAVMSGDLLDYIRQKAGSNPMPPESVVSPSAPPATPMGGPGALGLPKPAELLLEGVGGPTHSTGPHVHIAYTNPTAMLKAIKIAEAMGLSVRENPYVDSVDPVHAKNSYHYRDFPGLFNGKKLGEAIDVSGKNQGRLYQILKNLR